MKRKGATMQRRDGGIDEDRGLCGTPCGGRGLQGTPNINFVAFSSLVDCSIGDGWQLDRLLELLIFDESKRSQNVRR